MILKRILIVLVSLIGLVLLVPQMLVILFIYIFTGKGLYDYDPIPEWLIVKLGLDSENI
jgi:lipopolysaccharide/colanic/teichoic acid biosynthesis glycosyltransferase